jgi:hypothetical protein
MVAGGKLAGQLDQVAHRTASLVITSWSPGRK